MFNGYDFVYDGKSSISENLKLLYIDPEMFDFVQSIPSNEINMFRANKSSKWHISGVSTPEPLSFPIEIMLYSDEIDLSANGNAVIQRNRISRISHWLFDNTQFKKLQILTDDMRDMYFMAIFKDVEYFEAGGDVCGFRVTVLCDTIGAYEEKKITKSCTGNTKFSMQCLHDGIYEIFPTYTINFSGGTGRDVVYAKDNYGHEWTYYGSSTINQTNRCVLVSQNNALSAYDKVIDISYDYRRYCVKNMKITKIEGNTITVTDKKGNTKTYSGTGTIGESHDYLMRYSYDHSINTAEILTIVDDKRYLYMINLEIKELYDGQVRASNNHGYSFWYKGTGTIGETHRYLMMSAADGSINRNYDDEVVNILDDDSCFYFKMDSGYIADGAVETEDDALIADFDNYGVRFYFMDMITTDVYHNATDLNIKVNDDTIKLQNVTIGSTITIDSEKLMAKSSTNDNLYVGNRFNNGFPTLVYGKNTIEVDGSCNLTINYQLIREVGC